MNAKSNFILSFDPGAWESSVVTHTPRSWLPSSVRSRQAVNLSVWQTRAARGLSSHRAGRVKKRALAP